jgi:hypothetical protein
LVGFGGIGGIAGSLVFRSQDRLTGYKPGLWACLACSLLNIVLVTLLTMKFVRDNKKAKEGKLKIEGSEVSPFVSISRSNANRTNRTASCIQFECLCIANAFYVVHTQEFANKDGRIFGKIVSVIKFS